MPKIQVSDMRLGDKIKLGDYPYSYATVTKIEGDFVRVFRPYVDISDIAYGSGSRVIQYIGFEHIELYKMSSHTYDLVDRQEVK